MRCCSKCNKELNGHCIVSFNGDYVCAECLKSIKVIYEKDDLIKSSYREKDCCSFGFFYNEK